MDEEEVDEGQNMKENVIVPSCELILPTLKDLDKMNKADSPLLFAKQIFSKCSNILNSQKSNLRKVDLINLNEVGLKLMLNLDSFCSSTVERKLLIKELNLFCDLVENVIQETDKLGLSCAKLRRS